VKRLSAAVASCLLLLGLMPSAVNADRVSKGTDHYVSVGCTQAFDGGVASGFIEQFGEGAFAGLDIWLDPAVPFEEAATVSGSAEAIDVTDDGTTIELHASIPTFDGEGNAEGDADLTITVDRTGDIRVISPDSGKTNYNSKTNGQEEELAGTGTLSWNGLEIALEECAGVVGDVNFFSTNPRAFVSANTGVIIDCFWETETGGAGLFAVNDGFGFFADASYFDDEHELSSFGESSGSLDTSRVDLEIELEDQLTGDPASATASATFTPNGSPVTSTFVSEGGRGKTTEQALVADGTIEFSTGESFPMDDEHCNASWFESHSSSQPGAGPKGGPVPTNDLPEDAIGLEVGSRLNTSNVGTENEPEIQAQNCPQGFFDQFGNTLWYTIAGTGSPITIDTAGSNFDTLIAVYVPGDAGLEEIGCIDDVEFEPIGATFQAALTFETDEGVTYYVQIGGYDFPFDEEVIGQQGRLRIAVR
jgi:hypothetical protein